MITIETSRALFESIYKLDQVNNEVSELIVRNILPDDAFAKLDEARAAVIAAVSLLRSVMEQYR